ncbi:hypothetical protein [Phaeovulum vinaykumarii]|nr:hypothetical protein [Phaeovulum vinaykumarii]
MISFEGQRHLAQIVLQPIAQILAQEATAKLGGATLQDAPPFIDWADE